jgi:Na+:H+ antiporter, NhaA family
MRAEDTPRTPIGTIISPFVRFASLEAAGGTVLLAASLFALLWANSPWQHSYHEIFERETTIGVGRFVLTENWHAWINDGLMSLFFFMVGLEIKREILVGELSSFRRAAFPFVAAAGGMIAPALIYFTLAGHGDFSKGWAIPISTDIAFTLGALAFLGDRVPTSLKIFVTALAIADDIFVVVVIALFYTNHIAYMSLALGFACILAAIVANLLGVRNPAVYAVIGLFAWFCVLESGVHATIAGILLALTIPSNTAIDKSRFLGQSRSLLDRLEKVESNSPEEHSIIEILEKKMELVQSPLHRIEHALQPWIGFLVMPLFALANAGVNLSENAAAALRHPVTLGVVLGLTLGKPTGIWLFSFLAARTKIAFPPPDVSGRQILGAGCLCGIGFTMSLFVAELAFPTGQVLEISKIAITLASALSAILGCVFLTRQPGAVAIAEEPVAS